MDLPKGQQPIKGRWIFWQLCQSSLCCERLYTDLWNRLQRNFLTCCKIWDCLSGSCTCSTSWLGNQSTRCQNHLFIWWARWRNLYGTTRRFCSKEWILNLSCLGGIPRELDWSSLAVPLTLYTASMYVYICTRSTNIYHISPYSVLIGMRASHNGD